jgi:2'-5' RNA ligase
MPTGLMEIDLLEEIRRLAVLGTSPPFAPHVTVIGAASKSLDEITEHLDTLTISVVPCRLTEIATEATKFRSVTAEAESAPLEQLREELLAALGDDGDASHFPHLSLYYGDVSDVERERIRAAVELRVPLDFELSRVTLVDTTGDDVRKWRVLKTWNVSDPV